MSQLSVRQRGPNNEALYLRHLKLENVVEPESSDLRERYEAAASLFRDALVAHWMRTDETYARKNPKQAYYVSIEFLIDPSLGNNVMNLMLDPTVELPFDEHSHLWREVFHEDLDAGFGQRASAVWRPASWIRWRLGNSRR